MPHSAVSQNNYQVKFISLHMNRVISSVHYFNNPVTGSLTPITLTSFAAISMGRTNFNFKCGNGSLEIVDKYVYLGLLLTEHLEFEMTAKCVAQSASRALGLLISKRKLAGGLPYNVYTQLYDSVMSPVINYGACIWGFKSYSCINAVQNRAMRFFLGVGKYTLVAALQGEMGWEPSIAKQWICIGRFLVQTFCTTTS